MDKIEELNKELIEISLEICKIRQKSNEDDYHLLPEYHRIQEFGVEPNRLTKNYIEKFQNIHSIELPEIIKKISREYGEHVLTHFLFESKTKQKFITPKYIIEDSLFVELINKGIDEIKLDFFKDDYSDYFDPKRNSFKKEDMQSAYELLDKNNDRNFSKILDTCQNVEILLNTKNRGKLVSTHVGDKIQVVNGNKIYQPYYFIYEEERFSFENFYISYLESNIKRLKENIKKD